MNKISYPQLVKDIADSIRIATNTTESIPIGELASRITEVGKKGKDKGLEYKSIVYNQDDTITLIDNENVVHTIECNYKDDNLVSITYDGEGIKLNYFDDDLIRIANQQIDLKKVPLFEVGNVVYKSITYNDDNSITLIDINDNISEVNCTYENGRITSLTRDNEEMTLIYDGDELVAINDSKVDFELALVNNRFGYKSIVYNKDDSITLIDYDDEAHTLICFYEDGKMVSLTFDGQEMELNYNKEGLPNIEGSELNFENAPSHNNTDVTVNGLMFNSNPRAEIFTMYPTTVNINLFCDGTFNTGATAIITEG